MLPEESSNPTLSVVIVPFVGFEGLNKCLNSLSNQATSYPIEIIVPYDEKHSNFASLSQSNPKVRFLPLKGRQTYAQLRAVGAHAARGVFVAVTEDHCRPAPDWCESIIQAHKANLAGDNTIGAVGGAVEKETPDTVVNWAMYFADYVRYALPVAQGPVNSLTDLNVSYQKVGLDRHESIWSSEFHENEVHHAFQTESKDLWISPAIVVFQKRPYTFRGAMADRYAFGRLFASTRVGLISQSKRFILAVFSIFVPLLQMIRIIRHVMKKRRWGWELVKALPALAVLTTGWAVGEFVGYITGKAEASLLPEQ